MRVPARRGDDSPDSSPSIEFCRDFRFAAPPHAVWASIAGTDALARRCAWLGEFRIDGDGLTPGTVLSGVVSPPLPYRMRIEVVLDDCVEASSIDATVHGDLEGTAHLVLTADDEGTLVTAAWTVSMMQRTMQIANRVARPLLLWGHDRVVDATVAGFRLDLESRD